MANKPATEPADVGPDVKLKYANKHHSPKPSKKGEVEESRLPNVKPKEHNKGSAEQKSSTKKSNKTTKPAPHIRIVEQLAEVDVPNKELKDTKDVKDASNNIKPEKKVETPKAKEVQQPNMPKKPKKDESKQAHAKESEPNAVVAKDKNTGEKN